MGRLLCPSTNRTALFRTSAEYLFEELIPVFSQVMDLPVHPAQLSRTARENGPRIDPQPAFSRSRSCFRLAASHRRVRRLCGVSNAGTLRRSSRGFGQSDRRSRGGDDEQERIRLPRRLRDARDQGHRGALGGISVSAIGDALAGDDAVAIAGSGSFSARTRGPRRSRNRRTGETVHVPRLDDAGVQPIEEAARSRRPTRMRNRTAVFAVVDQREEPAGRPPNCRCRSPRLCQTRFFGAAMDFRFASRILDEPRCGRIDAVRVDSLAGFGTQSTPNCGSRERVFLCLSS